MRNPEPLFYIERAENEVAGPYDLVQMAGLLRKRIISPETATRLDGEDDWKPFSWRPQFIVAKEMSPNAVSTRVDRLDEEALERASGPIPLPSVETILRLVGMSLGSLLAGGAAFVVAYLDPATGYLLLFGGAAAGLVAYCMIMARFLDEDGWTMAKTWFIPGYDAFYMITNFWQYFPWLCVKYVGLAVMIGAAAGLAVRGASWSPLGGG